MRISLSWGVNILHPVDNPFWVPAKGDEKVKRNGPESAATNNIYVRVLTVGEVRRAKSSSLNSRNIYTSVYTHVGCTRGEGRRPRHL